MNDPLDNANVVDAGVPDVLDTPDRDSRERMEVENEKYGRRVMFLLPLSTGRIAVLYPNKRLYKIVDTWEKWRLELLSREAADEYASTHPDLNRTPKVDLKSIDLLEDLGL